MPRGKFTFKFYDYDRKIESEFDVDQNAAMDKVLEAFAVFLKLCGYCYDEGEHN